MSKCAGESANFFRPVGLWPGGSGARLYDDKDDSGRHCGLQICLLREGKTSAMLSFSLLLRGESNIHCDNFIEQRKHGCMTPHVVDANQCGSAVLWTQGFERKVVRSI